MSIENQPTPLIPEESSPSVCPPAPQEQEKLNWTSTKPKQDGWYWIAMNRPDVARVGIAVRRVMRHTPESPLRVYAGTMGWRELGDDALSLWRWAGPIQEPAWKRDLSENATESDIRDYVNGVLMRDGKTYGQRARELLSRTDGSSDASFNPKPVSASIERLSAPPTKEKQGSGETGAERDPERDENGSDRESFAQRSVAPNAAARNLRGLPARKAGHQRESDCRPETSHDVYRARTAD